MNVLKTQVLMLFALLLCSITTVRAVDGGTVSSNAGDTLTACTSDGIPDLITMSNTSLSTDAYAYVLTTPATEVLAISVDGIFDLDGFSDGENWIWGLSYTGNVLIGIGDTVLTFGALTDSTSDLSSNYVVVNKFSPDAGTLTADASSACLNNGSATISATPNGDINIPAGYSSVYVLTEGAGLVIEQAGGSPSFTVTSEGSYTIHTLVYDPNTLDLSIVVPGVTTGFDVNSLLVQGGGSICGSLDVAGAPIAVEGPFAGTLTADASSACLNNGSATISATPNGDINIPTGYSSVYVLTKGAGLVIEQAGGSPSFTVTSEGSYTIHTLVYDPNTLDLSIVVPGVTTGFDVNALLVQGGGSICGSLDVAGAPIAVEGPFAGTLTADASSVCTVNGSATISATPNGDINIPAGYSSVYVLTKGAGLVIEQAGGSPSFTVTSEGSYTIHTLVYDPNTLDLSIVVPGVTTGFDVNALLVQGGGSICGSLDVAGAPIAVEGPFAGTLTADASSVCTVNGSATISATPNGDINIPAGYSSVYVLTEGAGLVIQNAGGSPSFTVTSGGSYTIHTLVYDPNTLDLSIVEIGVTTGFDVNALLVQGGGSICGSLDVAGAPIAVEGPFAGTLTADASSACLSNGSATISATPNGDINIPAGYSSVYVLTEGAGLVIQNAGGSPSFTVTSGGSYTIHTLVYDPNTLDLSIVEIGVTTGFDVNALLVQGGGSICGSLDVAGAPIAVEGPFAGTLTADASSACLSNGSATISATPNGDINIPAGYSSVYVLTEGAGLVIQNAGATPSFTVTSGGSYTIHTLVYDPNTLDLSIVVPGVTTGFDVNALLVQGGGSICGSLDVAGAPITVEGPFAGTLTADASSVCTVNGSATISATPNGDINIPAGYSSVYVLTEGAGLVIQNAGGSPSFTVTSGGSYTIHTLVYDPNTLDLSIVVPGVTTGFDVNALLVQGGGSICGSLDVAGAPVSVGSSGITGLTLVNSFTDADIAPLNDGDTINLFYTPNINVRAEICGTTGSIRFTVNGSSFSIENIAPYAIAGDAPNGNYKNWNVTPGTYTITATPYTRGGAFGTAGTPFTVTITVIDEQLPCSGPGCCSIDTDCDDGDFCTTDFCNAGNCINTPAGIREISGFTLVDAATDTDIAPLGNGSVIDLDATPNVNVRANLCSNSGTGSVKFKVNGISFRTENIAPFALAGDNPTGDYRQWHIKPGTYTIEAKAYAGANGSGSAGTGQFITITVIGGSFKNSGEENALDTYEALPVSASLSAFPNPFSDQVNIRFSVASAQRVKLELTTIEGKTIATLFDGTAGESMQYNFSYSAQGLSDGIYLYRLLQEDGTITNGKLMLMRQ